MMVGHTVGGRRLGIDMESGKMDLVEEIREHIRQYLAGRLSVNDLQIALSEHYQPASDAARNGDPYPEALVDAVLALLSEYSLGHRGLDDLLEAVAVVLEPARAPTVLQIRVDGAGPAPAVTGPQGQRDWSHGSMFQFPASWPGFEAAGDTRGIAKPLPTTPAQQ